MQPLVRVGPWLVAVALVVVVVLSWVRSKPELTQADAETVAVGALASQGVDVEVASPATQRPFESATNGPALVWDIALAAGEETITVKVPLDVGELVFIDDNIGPAAAPGRLLTDAQVDALDDYKDNPALDRRNQENAALSIGALLAFIVCLGIWWVAAIRGPESSKEVIT